MMHYPDIVEVNLGSTPTWRGTFIITDSRAIPSNIILIYQAPGPYTGKGTLADEAEMDLILATAVAAVGSIKVSWRTVAGVRSVVDYTQKSGVSTKVFGLVKGNVKFYYTGCRVK